MECVLDFLELETITKSLYELQLSSDSDSDSAKDEEDIAASTEHCDLDLNQLHDVAMSWDDPDVTTKAVFRLTEELCIKIEVYRLLLFILQPNSILRLQDEFPGIFINTDCCSGYPYKFHLHGRSTQTQEPKLPDICQFRSHLKTVREYLLFVCSLSALECDTIACFQIDEIVTKLQKNRPLPVKCPCNCPQTNMAEQDSESSETEYVQELLSSCSEDSFSIKQMFELQHVSLSVDDSRPEQNQDHGGDTSMRPSPHDFHHRGVVDLMDNCHCVLCVQRRKDDKSFEDKDGLYEDDIDLVFEAFYSVQCFLEEYAFSQDLSPLLYIEQRLCRMVHYNIMEWLFENGYHSSSKLFDCPCKSK